MNKLVFLMALFLTTTQAFAAAPELNQPAPDFSLPDADGKTHALSQHRGKIVVLEWTNPECPFVQRHYNSNTMATLAQKYAAKNVVWLAIDSSHHRTAEMSRKWAKEQALSYPILQDPDGKVGRLYAAKTTPHMFIIDANGLLVYNGAIDNDSWGIKKGKDLTNYVDAALEYILAGKPPAAATTKPYGCSVKYR